MFLHVLRGVENFSTIGAGVLLTHLVDHVLVGPQTYFVPELLHADVAMLPVPLCLVRVEMPGQPPLSGGYVAAELTYQRILAHVVATEMLLTN